MDAVADTSCGQIFYSYRGRIAWPALRNAGPITIAVQTHMGRGALDRYPVYIEIVNRADTLICQTYPAAIMVAIIAQGTLQCGGVWESIGPIDLTRHGIPIGGMYRIMAEFFADPPSTVQRRSVALACVRVTSHPTAVTTLEWGKVKTLYR